jgi:hypothetical protein
VYVYVFRMIHSIHSPLVKIRRLGIVVDIATAYGLDSPGIEKKNPGAGENFRTCPDRPWGPFSLLYNGYRVFPEGKVRQGSDADSSPLSSAEVKNRVELYLYTT